MVMQLARAGYEAGLVTADADRALAFYGDVLGFPRLDPIVVPGHCTIHRLDVGGTVLRIVAPEQTPQYDRVEHAFMAAAGLRYLLFECRDLPAVIEAVRAAGAEIVVEPWQVRPGRLVSQVRDPDGNYLELAENLPG